MPKKENGGEEKEDLTKNTEKLILDLENILRGNPTVLFPSSDRDLTLCRFSVNLQRNLWTH